MEESEAEKIWGKLEKKLEKELDKIREKGNKLIPETTLEKILNNGGKIPEKVRRGEVRFGMVRLFNTKRRVIK